MTRLFDRRLFHPVLAASLFLLLVPGSAIACIVGIINSPISLCEGGMA
jgi:hypothetical protein